MVRELERHITRTLDCLDLARIELERTAPEASKALNLNPAVDWLHDWLREQEFGALSAV